MGELLPRRLPALNAGEAAGEMALAHTVRNKTEAAYARSDLFEARIPLMEAWAAFCQSTAISA